MLWYTAILDINRVAGDSLGVIKVYISDILLLLHCVLLMLKKFYCLNEVFVDPDFRANDDAVEGMRVKKLLLVLSSCLV